MKIEGFELRHKQLDKSQIAEVRTRAYVLGTGHRQLFHYDRYPNTIVMTDNASNCLAGLCVLSKGVFTFHDPPLQVMHVDLPLSERAKGEGIIGGSLQHWETVRDTYLKRSGIIFTYVEKPNALKMNTDYSFAFIVNMGKRTIDYGYYYNPKGLSSDGWIWE